MFYLCKLLKSKQSQKSNMLLNNIQLKQSTCSLVIIYLHFCRFDVLNFWSVVLWNISFC